MFGSVEKASYTGPVEIGIGTVDQHRQLSALGCERVYDVRELQKGEHDSGDPVQMIFRAGDIVVMLQPGLMPAGLMRSVAATGVVWRVPGHDAVSLSNDDDRAAWRRQKPRDLDVAIAPDVMGRPPKWPVPNDAQVRTIVSLWHGKGKPSDILPHVQKLMGAPVPKHWVRDQVIKATGSARRSPQGEQG